MEPLVVRKVRRRVLPYFLGSLAIVAVAVWLLGRERATGDDGWMGWLMLIVFGVLTVVAGKQLIVAGVMLKLDESGFQDRDLGDTVIPWSAVEWVELRKLGSAWLLCVELKDPGHWLARRSAVHKLLAVVNMALGYPRYFVNLVATEPPAEEVLRRFQLGVDSAGYKPSPRQGT